MAQGTLLWFSGPGGSPALLWGEGPTGTGIPDTGPDLSGHSWWELTLGRWGGPSSLWQSLFPRRMAEPRFNNPYFWPPPPTMPSQVRRSVFPPAALSFSERLGFGPGFGCCLLDEEAKPVGSLQSVSQLDLLFAFSSLMTHPMTILKPFSSLLLQFTCKNREVLT